MTKLEELKLRLIKLEQFFASLSEDEKTKCTDDIHFPTTLAKACGEEFDRIEMEIAKLRINEALDVDIAFEKEVLDVDINR